MNSPARPDAPASAPDIAALRAQIDAIDADLASLIARRSGLARAIAAAKAGGDEGFGWRPAREVSILRAVLSGPHRLDPGLACSVWRALIAANLAAQGPLRVVATPGVAATAQLAFGSAVSVQVGDVDEVLDRVASMPRTIAVLPFPGPSDWWVRMADPALRDVNVCAAAPMAGGGGRPQALLLARLAPEPAGGDWSLLIGPARAEGPGETLAQAAGLRLGLVQGFADAASAPAGGRVLGAYALA